MDHAQHLLPGGADQPQDAEFAAPGEDGPDERPRGLSRKWP
ncbi:MULTISPECIES: hypothetical protein [Streptomyces]